MYSLKLIKKYFELYLKKQTVVKLNFSILIADIIMQLTIFLIYINIFTYVDDISGYTKTDMYLFLGISQVTFSIFSFLFGNIFRLGNTYIREGTLTKMLVRPVNLLLQIFLDDLYLGDLGGLIVGIATIIFAIVTSTTQTFFIMNYIMLFISIILASIILLGFFLILVSANFYSIGTMDLQLLFLRNLNASKYPLIIFPKIVQVIFVFVFPFAVIGFFPKLIFDLKYEYLLLMIILAIIFIFIGLKTFYTGLKNYKAVN